MVVADAANAADAIWVRVLSNVTRRTGRHKRCEPGRSRIHIAAAPARLTRRVCWSIFVIAREAQTCIVICTCATFGRTAPVSMRIKDSKRASSRTCVWVAETSPSCVSLALSANGARYARVGPSRGVQLGEHAARRAVSGIVPDSSAGSVGGGAASHRHVLPAAAEAAPASRRHKSRPVLCNRGSDSTGVPLRMYAQTRRWRILRQDESEMSKKWVENGLQSHRYHISGRPR